MHVVKVLMTVSTLAADSKRSSQMRLCCESSCSIVRACWHWPCSCASCSGRGCPRVAWRHPADAHRPTAPHPRCHGHSQPQAPCQPAQASRCCELDKQGASPPSTDPTQRMHTIACMQGSRSRSGCAHLSLLGLLALPLAHPALCGQGVGNGARQALDLPHQALVVVGLLLLAAC